jgi:hypothetical protein
MGGCESCKHGPASLFQLARFHCSKDHWVFDNASYHCVNWEAAPSDDLKLAQWNELFALNSCEAAKDSIDGEELRRWFAEERGDPNRQTCATCDCWYPEMAHHRELQDGGPGHFAECRHNPHAHRNNPTSGITPQERTYTWAEHWCREWRPRAHTPEDHANAVEPAWDM